MSIANTDVVLGIDLGGTSIKGGIVDIDGACVSLTPVQTEAQAGAPTILRNIRRVVDAGVALSTERRLRLIGVGVGTPGGVQQPEGRILGGADNLAGWRDTTVGTPLAEHLGGLPVIVDNDANAATLGEWRFGNQSPSSDEDFVGLTLGTGVGGGWIREGKLVRGRFGLGGEFGHMCIVAGGRRCNCGGHGCLEMYASIRGVQAIANDIRERGIRGGWVQVVGPDIVRAATAAADAGDAQALELWREYGRLLGAGVSAIIVAVQPVRVALLGGIAHAATHFLPTLRAVLAERGPYCDGVDVYAGKLRTNAGVLGAAALVWMELGEGALSSNP